MAKDFPGGRIDGGRVGGERRVRLATPGWAAEYTKTVEIGEFLFYKPREGDARYG
jgi:hypothetical protein